MRCVGIHPYFHQRAVIDELINAKGTGKVVCCNSSRQKGKSYMDSNLLLYYAINYNQSNVFLVTPTLKQAKIVYKLIINAIQKSGIILHRNATELHIELLNGSTIDFKSAEQRDGLRGYTADFLIIDEAAFIPDDVFYSLILPWVSVKKAPILMTSTPFLKSGFFWKYFCMGKEGRKDMVTVDWTEERFRESISELLSEEKLEEYRKQLPKNVFKTEYLGQFLDDDGTVFTNIHNNLQKTEIQPEDKLFVGLDWASGKDGDDTVISVFNQNGEQVYLKYFNNRTTTNQIDVIVAELEPYAKQIEVISSESNSLGTPMTDFLKSKSHLLAQKVKEFNTSHTSKNSIVLQMQVALEQNEVKLLPDEKQIMEFGYYSAEYNPKTGNVIYNAPQGMHDDIPMATMFAYNARKTYMTSGMYCVGGKRKNNARDRFERFR